MTTTNPQKQDEAPQSEFKPGDTALVDALRPEVKK